jgi:hypothetical protein
MKIETKNVTLKIKNEQVNPAFLIVIKLDPGASEPFH